MKILIVFCFTALVTSICAIAGEESRVEAFDPLPISHSLIMEQDLGMRSGTESMLGLHRAWTLTEERVIDSRWFPERGLSSKTGGIAIRFAKYFFLDRPVDYFTPVLLHEYFGHGARYRELGIENVHYAFDTPPPYGEGGGEAVSSILKSRISDHEEIAIWSGGIEIQSLVNRALSLDWITRREIEYREASLYFLNFQIMYNYVYSSKDFSEDLADNDPRAYVRILNRNAGYTDLDNLRFSMDDLQSSGGLNLINPFVFLAIYAQLKTYLFDGVTETPLPMIPIGEYRYLPSLRTGFAPFGPEHHLENYIRTPRRAALIDLRVGDQTFHKSWGGIGVEVRNAFESGRVSLDLNLDLWKQPEIELDGMNGKSKGGGLGGASSIRGYYRIMDSEFPFLALLELGYKSPGFLEGYALDSTPIFMIGAAIRE